MITDTYTKADLTALRLASSLHLSISFFKGASVSSTILSSAMSSSSSKFWACALSAIESRTTIAMSDGVYRRSAGAFFNSSLKAFLNLVFLERVSIVMYFHSKLFLNLVFNFHSKLFLNFVFSTLIAIYFRLKLFLNFERS